MLHLLDVSFIFFSFKVFGISDHGTDEVYPASFKATTSEAAHWKRQIPESG
jgi:hypothetical protein